MKKIATAIIFIILLASTVQAQPEFYSDDYIGLPEFRALFTRLPSSVPDSVKLEVHVRIVYDDLQFVKEKEEYRASYGLDVIIRDRDERLMGLKHLDREIIAINYSQTNSRQHGDQTKTTLRIPPGRFDIKIILNDRESKKNRILEHEVDFTGEEWNHPIQLGDLVLVDSSGVAQLAGGVSHGQPIRVAHRIYCENKEGLSILYQLMDEHDHLVQAGKITLQGEGPYFAETLELPSDSLDDQFYRFFLAAKFDDNTITRSYPITFHITNLPDFIRDISLAIEQLKYVASDDEYDYFKKAPPSKREELFKEFWRKKDPTPGTLANEKMDEYYRRIRYANNSFSGFKDGWKSDMGKIYVIFGAPTDVKRYPFSINVKPYEIWYYYDIHREFIFVDEEGFGQYRLKTPIWEDYVPRD
ncbi:hypothetical protein CEE37_06270 [candidate division LCP-89 bacterium B3_LCP]|uniref:GWxTD domain-containing protein n=1 Tax=candidate division LCP-89 bacterium B3_LCP TaxID=2012998 RepID=A0A532V2A5_UNCL8|nr:MAG: hypothetical protein CEE37_06270 [candidate division LCP-89 bacterium B3_LCP]